MNSWNSSVRHVGRAYAPRTRLLAGKASASNARNCSSCLRNSRWTLPHSTGSRPVIDFSCADDQPRPAPLARAQVEAGPGSAPPHLRTFVPVAVAVIVLVVGGCLAWRFFADDGQEPTRAARHADAGDEAQPAHAGAEAHGPAADLPRPLPGSDTQRPPRGCDRERDGSGGSRCSHASAPGFAFCAATGPRWHRA